MIYKTINLNWLGHAGFRINSLNKIIYIDPFKISEESEKADIIFLTHSHQDHCSIEDIQKISKDKTIIVCPADVSSKLRHIDKKIDIRIAEIGLEFNIDEIKVWAVYAYNLNKRFHTREEDWVGYIIDFNGTILYHAGDTDLIPEMSKLKAIGIDIALLPVGGTYTMTGEAAKAASIIKPKIAIPMHYGSLEGIGSKSDADIFAKLCSSEGIEVRILEKEK